MDKAWLFIMQDVRDCRSSGQDGEDLIAYLSGYIPRREEDDSGYRMGECQQASMRYTRLEKWEEYIDWGM